MRLAKFASQKNKKNSQLKYEFKQQQSTEWSTTKCQTGSGTGTGIVKRFSGTLSILSSSNNSGSAPRNSFGNGSCISSTASINNTCSNKKRKSKTTKCFSSTVFRCCLPCRGGSGSAAPATSPPLTPVPPTNSNSTTADITATRKRSGHSAFQLTTDGNESLIAAVKKHSLAETIGTSATTPISLKTLINDEEEEDLQQHISAADIAAAKLASGILPRKAEPETLSDTSISPTTAGLQLAANSASASSLLSATTSFLSTTAANTQVTFIANKSTTTQISPTAPPNTQRNFINQLAIVEKVNNIVPTTTTIQTPETPVLPLQPLNTTAASAGGITAAANINATTTTTTTTSSTTVSSTPSRCCCPPPQTSPLPHIQEEEESEQSLQRQYSANHDDEALTEPTSERQIAQQQQSQLDQLSPFTVNPSGSSDSCTSLSATAVTTATTSSITGGGCTPQEFTNTSTPSPRIKHKFRKQHKSGWSRIILAPSSGLIPQSAVANSSETLATSSNNSCSAIAVSAALSAAAQTRLTSSSATALATQPTSLSQLLPANKMQAEQGSIGDLQKYHSRYLKNRRHTLANVR